MKNKAFLFALISSSFLAITATVQAADIANADDKILTILLANNESIQILTIPPFAVIRNVCDECSVIIDPDSETPHEAMLFDDDLAIFADDAIEILTDHHPSPQAPHIINIHQNDGRAANCRMFIKSKNKMRISY